MHDYSVGYVLEERDDSIKSALLLKDIILEKKCFIGANTIVLPGTRIGKNTLVGSGSVVKGHFPDNVVIAGNSARVVILRKNQKERFRRY